MIRSKIKYMHNKKVVLKLFYFFAFTGGGAYFASFFLVINWFKIRQ